MGFYFFGLVSLLFAIGLAAFGVFFKNIGPKLRNGIIYVSALISMPGFMVIWDFAVYRIIWLFPWS